MEEDSPNSMDKVYRKYKDAKMNPQKLMDELGIDITEGDNLGMSVVRKVRGDVEEGRGNGE